MSYEPGIQSNKELEFAVFCIENIAQRLRYEKPNLQLCFRTDAALSRLHFEGGEMV